MADPELHLNARISSLRISVRAVKLPGEAWSSQWPLCESYCHVFHGKSNAGIKKLFSPHTLFFYVLTASTGSLAVLLFTQKKHTLQLQLRMIILH